MNLHLVGTVYALIEICVSFYIYGVHTVSNIIMFAEATLHAWLTFVTLENFFVTNYLQKFYSPELEHQKELQ